MTSLDEHRDFPGFIAEIDFHRPELHGFEIGLDGRLYVPSFPPRAAIKEAT
jgi:hypothetical protein